MSKQIELLLFLVVMVWSYGSQAGQYDSSSRAVTLNDLGLTEAVELNTNNSEQHFYLPMPQGVALRRARFELSATYSQPFAERSALTILIDGKPVMTRQLSGADTAVNWVLPLKAVRSDRDFLDVGVVLSARIEAEHCIDERGRGQSLSIDTLNTRLVYSYENRAVHDIRSYLGTLPRRPVVLLPGNALSEAQYDAAVHLSSQLSEMGLQPELLPVPRIGDRLRTAGMEVTASMPKKLRVAVENGEDFKFENAEEIGAWLLSRMQAPNGLAQLVIDPAASRQALLEVVNQSAIRISARWGKPDNWLRHGIEGGNVEVMQLAGYPVLGIGEQDAVRGVDLVASEWKRIANSRAMGLASAVSLNKVMADVAEIHLAQDQPVLQVGARAQWQIPVRLGDLPAGRWPDAFELNLMASPASDGIFPVATVFLNDNLLTASTLRTDGQMTRITARIPQYALRARNILKVQISRRIESGPCKVVSQLIPVQLLPSSFLSLTDAPEPAQFFMMESMLAQQSDVIVPSAYLQDAERTLPAVNAVLQGLSTTGGRYVVRAATDKMHSPKHPFVSFEIPPVGVSEMVKVSDGRLVVRNGEGQAVFDSSGLNDALVMQLVRSHGESGVYVSAVTGNLPRLPQSLELSTGTLAVADAGGVRLAVNLNDPDNDLQLDEQNRSVKLFFYHYRFWFLLLGFLLLPVVVVLGLRLYYRRRKLQA